MPDYADAGHRPHAVHTGETPTTSIDRGPYALKVTLDTWGPQDNLFPTIYDALQANWGEAPSRVVDAECGQIGLIPPGKERADHYLGWKHRTGWCKLTDHERAYVESCFAGRTLPQILELISFSFCIDGLCRPATHQIVRSRIGAGFMQHGGRDNDWRHRGWTMPETMHRACEAYDHEFDRRADIEGTLQHCVTNWDPIDQYLNTTPLAGSDLRTVIRDHLEEGKRLYAALVDAGIPWQDARRVLPMGMQTYIHADYSWPALKGVLANRLEFVMDWEINCVAQLMVRELRMKTPEIIWRHLVSASDAARKAARAGLESWPPDGKWPVEDRHKNLPRTHTALQNPFWVLDPSSLTGGPVIWIPTNGEYPHSAMHAELAKTVGGEA